MSPLSIDLVALVIIPLFGTLKRNIASTTTVETESLVRFNRKHSSFTSFGCKIKYSNKSFPCTKEY